MYVSGGPNGQSGAGTSSGASELGAASVSTAGREDEGGSLETALEAEMEAGSTGGPPQQDREGAGSPLRSAPHAMHSLGTGPLVPIASQQPRAGKGVETPSQFLAREAREALQAQQAQQQAVQQAQQQALLHAQQQQHREQQLLRKTQVEIAVGQARQELIRTNADHARVMGMNVNATPALAQKRDEKLKGLVAKRLQAESVIAQLLEKLPKDL